jgi:nitrogen-specific signal transduction histidine kinase
MARSDTAHEINNLLSKILGAAELALDFAAHPAARRELELIATLAEDGARLVAGLEGAVPSRRA